MGRAPVEPSAWAAEAGVGAAVQPGGAIGWQPTSCTAAWAWRCSEPRYGAGGEALSCDPTASGPKSASCILACLHQMLCRPPLKGDCLDLSTAPTSSHGDELVSPPQQSDN